MDFIQLKQSLSEPKKIYLLEGEETFFRIRGENQIKKQFLVEPDFNLTNINGANLKTSLEPLLTAIPICPFLGDYRVIVITEWYPKAEDFKNKELKNFFSTPLGSTIVIISNSKKSDVLKKQPSVEFVDCKKGDISTISKFLQNEAMKNNLIISRSNCTLIAEFCLYDMTKISMEIKKLISFCDGQAEITEDAINQLVHKETDYKVYEVVNFIVEKKNDKAIQILREMVASGEAQLLLVSVYNHFRRLLHTCLSKQSNSVIASQLGVKEFAVTKMKEQARQFTPKRLMAITQKLTDYDTAFKSGKISLESAVENAIYTILSE